MEVPTLASPVQLSTQRLIMRAWRDTDRDAFAAINADPVAMEFFPSTISRAGSDASIDAWQKQFVERGWSNWAIELKSTGQFIGFVGLSVPVRALPFTPCVEVGWRLDRSAWGQGYASEAAREALRFGFDTLRLAEIVSFTSAVNTRSRAVMERIGMNNAHEDFEHPAIPEGSHLRLHCLYSISRQQWKDSGGQQPPRLPQASV